MLAPSCAFFVAASIATPQELVPEKVMEIDLGASDPVLEGYGPSCTFEYEVTFDGTLCVWATSSTGDPVLRILDSQAEPLAEDDDSGGGTTACVTFDVLRNEHPQIAVAIKAPSSGRVMLHVSEAPETWATRAGAARALRAVAAAEQLEAPDARAKLIAALDELLRIEGATRSARVAEACHYIGTAAEARGEFQSARAARTAYLDHLERTLPDEAPRLQSAREGLACTLYDFGEVASSRSLFEKVLEVRSRTLPDDHHDLLHARHNVARTLLSLGDIPGARTLLERLVDTRSRTLPDDHHELQTAREGLACTMVESGDHASALPLFQKVLQVRSRTLSDDDPILQSARLNVAAILEALGDVTAARVLDEKVLEVNSRTLPDEHPELQRARQNLAGTYYALGDLARARALYERVLEIRSRTLPEDHPNLQSVRRDLARTIASQCARAIRSPQGNGNTTADTERERDKCIELISAVCRAQVQAAQAAILGSPSREALERLTSLDGALDTSLSFALGFGVFEPLRELDSPSFAFLETTRGASIISAELRRKAAHLPEYEVLGDALRLASDELARLVYRGTTSEEFDRARSERESAERGLAVLASELLGEEESGMELDVNALTARLGDHQGAVSFRRFTKLAVEILAELDSTGEPLLREAAVESLCAFVVRRPTSGASVSGRSAIVLVDLGPIEVIESAARAWREAVGLGVERGMTVHDSATDQVSVCSEELRRLVLDPLIPALAGLDHWVVALDDVLHLVPLDALALEGTAELVGMRWRIETRATLAELMTEASEPTGETLVALGGASFNLPPVALPTEEVAPVEHANPPIGTAALLRGTAWERGFAPLTHTADEVRGIAALYTEMHGNARPALVLEKHNASREALAEFAPRARFVHVATHGWFAPNSIESWADPRPLDAQTGLGARRSGDEQVRGMSPMILCGLAFAGANLPPDATGRIAGLVTADELSTLDLSNCELVVLSACDTNVGIRRAGQGVASLQQALQMAGARSVITSLWKVPDEATKDLMLDFYRRLWVEKKPKWQALWEAKMRIRDAKDETGAPKYTTRDWAAWMLTGEPE